MNADEKQLLGAALINRLVVYLPRPRAYCLINVTFEKVTISLPENAAGSHGALQIQPLEQDLADYLRHRREDAQAARRAERQTRARIAEDDGRRHIGDRALVRSYRVWMSGLALHIRDVVVENNTVALNDHTAAEEVTEGLAHRHNGALAIDDDKVGRAAAGRRRSRLGKQLRPINLKTIRVANQRLQVTKRRAQDGSQAHGVLVVVLQGADDAGAATRRRRRCDDLVAGKFREQGGADFCLVASQILIPPDGAGGVDGALYGVADLSRVAGLEALFGDDA